MAKLVIITIIIISLLLCFLLPLSGFVLAGAGLEITTSCKMTLMTD